jgi:cytochrome c peroxidase
MIKGDDYLNGTRLFLGAIGLPTVLLCGLTLLPSYADDHDDLEFRDPSGKIRTVSTHGKIDTSNPFFKSLGTNGRSCVTCHQPSDAWSITPGHLRDRFDETNGRDPIFRLNDGANSPNADVSTVRARRDAYSMLLTKGLLRIGLAVPANAEFTVVTIDDPYHYADASRELSLFRRPLPTTNLPFITGVMWDARETITPIAGSLSNSVPALLTDLMHQADDATTGHAQAAHSLTTQQQREIADFELSLFTAQSTDDDAGKLDGEEALGGPSPLPTATFFIGINDTLGADPTGMAFNPVSMTLYDAWANLSSDHDAAHKKAREKVVRGQALFNTKPIRIVGVRGLNDALGAPVIAGTCTTCHNSPNVGNHSVALALDIGLTDASRRTPDMPLYTLRNKATLETIQTTDPGRAMLTGKWKDVARFKGPILRGLAARAPYFHNGFAATLEDAVDFYDTRFGIGFTLNEKSDLAAFLKTL